MAHGDDPLHPGGIPFRQILLKVASRCNLACDYCYVYEHADQSWRTRPRIMPEAILRRAAERIGEHAQSHRLASMRVILHGGEPLLAGHRYLDWVATLLRAAVGSETRVELSVQTNGLLLDEKFLAVFAAHGIRVGVSLDGTPAGHDRHRRQSDRRGSYPQVARALGLLTEERHRQVYGGLLCVVDLEADPVACYEALLKFAPPQVDLLLPHGSWSTPPPRRFAGDAATPYADWLIAVFNRWYAAPRRETRIRLFEAILEQLFGGSSTVESLGLAPIDVLSIETDGSLEQADSLKSVATGAAATGLHISTHPLDAAMQHPGILARQRGLSGLVAACRHCPVVRVCGGGLYAHRYRADNGFANPSVYCPDLFRLIRHVENRTSLDLETLSSRRGSAASTP